MRGDWDDVNRRLLSAMLALDVDDALVIGDHQDPPRRGIFGKRPPPQPRRFVQITAARMNLIVECVGSTSFGGDWPMTAETEAALLRQGWEKPWSQEYRTFQREAALVMAPRLALATVRALKLLGCEVADLDVELIREEPSGR